MKKDAKGYHCFFVGDLVLPERNGSASQAWGSLGLRFAELFAVLSFKGRRSDERVCLAFWTSLRFARLSWGPGHH